MLSSADRSNLLNRFLTVYRKTWKLNVSMFLSVALVLFFTPMVYLLHPLDMLEDNEH